MQALSLVEFENRPLRITHAEIMGELRPVVPANDVADAVGYDHKTLRNIVHRNQLIERLSVRVNMTSTDGKRYNYLCLCHEGVIGVLLRLEPDMIRNPEKRARVERFQEWALTTLARVMRGEPVGPQGPQFSPEQLAQVVAGAVAAAVSQALAPLIVGPDRQPRQSTAPRVGRPTSRRRTSGRRPAVPSSRLTANRRTALRARREELGLSQTAMARLMNVSRPYITLIESGDRTPPPDLAGRISGVLGRTAEELGLSKAEGASH